MMGFLGGDGGCRVILNIRRYVPAGGIFLAGRDPRGSLCPLSVAAPRERCQCEATETLSYVITDIAILEII